MIATIITDELLATGLCMTCNNSPTCFYHARRGPALYCEMFDGYLEPGEPEAVVDMSQRVAASTKAQSSVEAVRYTGLCMNCEMRNSCRMPKPEGGVWHCENYQ